MAGGDDETAVDPQRPARVLGPGTGLNGIYRIEERLGAVHRDLSPDNIILADGDPARATLIDFGIVKELDPRKRR